jgi:heparan-alpha-glucosaminide N-acetyltransferase
MTEPTLGSRPQRLMGLDAYRGFIMLVMASAGFTLAKVATHHPESAPWEMLAYQLDHVPWRGGGFWDLIQPSFMFMVGVAMPFSYADRRARGQSWSQLFRHALGRSLTLIALGIFLSSAGGKSTQTNFTFVNVLTQIGLGYMVVFLLLGRSPRVQVGAALAILAGSWLLFAAYPLPSEGFDLTAMGVPVNWKPLTGFFAHWEKNANVASAFDVWFLNLFPRPAGDPFRYNEGGYATLNFIPSIATMIFGVLAGELLRGDRPAIAKLQTLAIVGALCLAGGTLLDATLCPIVKRIWTPSWAISSTGWTCWMLAFFHGTIDVAGYRRWAFPLVVVGLNSIAMYVMAQLLKPFIATTLKIHCGTAWKALATAPAVDRFVFERTGTHLDPHLFGGPYGPAFQSAAVLFVLWLVCLWMYRQKIFVKI